MPCFFTEIQKLPLEKEGMELHLVHRGPHGGLGGKILEVVREEVAHPDGAHGAVGEELLQRLPRDAGLALHRPVDEVRKHLSR